jgi:hypothetical protein
MASYFSRARPMGSTRVWQLAQLSFVQMHGQALAVGHGLALVEVGKVGVDAGRGLGHLLAEEVFANEEAALGGAGVGGLGGGGEEHGVAEDAGALGRLGGKGTRSYSSAEAGRL